MKIRIGVIDNPIYEPLYSELEKAKEKYDIQFFKLDEKSIVDLFFARRLDLALLSPLGYAKGVKKADFRIIPTNALSTIGLTNVASTYYKPNAKNVANVGSPNPEEFLMEIGRILMAERYDLVFDLKKSSTDLQESFKEFDSIIKFGKEDIEAVTMDVTEDWFDSYQMPLPLAFWVCYSDEISIPFVEVTENLTNLKEKFVELQLENKHNSESEFMWKWDDDVFNATEQVLQLLFFHKVLTEIPAVKVYNQKEKEKLLNDDLSFDI